MDTAVNTKKATAKKVTKIVLNVLLWIFLIFSVLMMVFVFASSTNDYALPILGDKIILNVASDSMEPVIDKGDMIAGKVLTIEEKEALKVGDIITFYADIDGDGIKEINTHRIVKVTGAGEDITFRTKGDNMARYPVNVADDGYDIYPDDIISTWEEGDTQLHGIGSFFAFLQTRLGFFCVVVIPLILFFLYEIIRFVVMFLKVKGKDKREISEDEKEAIRRQAIEEYRKSLSAGDAPAEDAAPADSDAGDDAKA